MKVQSNLLYYDNGVQVPFKKSPNFSGIMIPSYLIIHYDGSGNATGAIDWMINSRGKEAVSAHLHISRDGNVVQLVPFNRVAWHAGVSSWKGISGLNSYSIGIELQNTGGQQYTSKQLEVLTEVAKALVSAYKLKEILGHSDIAPGRKIDPGKMFPMEQFRKDVYGLNTNVVIKNVTADVLNVRSGGGTNFPVTGQLKKNDPVNVLRNIEDWSEVLILANNTKGWVNNKYLSK